MIIMASGKSTNINKLKFFIYGFLFWTAWVFLYSLALTIQGQIPSWWIALFSSAVYNYTYGLFSIAIWFICKKISITRFHPVSLVIIHFLLSVFFSAMWLFLVYGSWYLQEGKVIFEIVHFNEIVSWQFLFGMMTYLLVAGIFYTIIYYQQFQEKTIREAEMKLLTRDAELKALKMQINPHFLFNSLNSINALVTKNPTLARKMIEVLSDLFRISLDLKDKILLTVKDELEFAHKYLEIEKIRFSDRLTIREDIDSSLLDKQFPALILQPLLENCIKHGITEKRGKCSIFIKIFKNNSDCITCIISNTINKPISRQNIQQGTGLKNIKHRLRLLFDNNYIFSLDNADSKEFVVKISIPIIKDE